MTEEQYDAVLSGCTQKCLGGAVEITGGLSSGGVGGAVVLTGGDTNSTDPYGKGGNVELRGGYSEYGVGGDLILDSGYTGTGNSSQEGKIYIAPTHATYLSVGREGAKPVIADVYGDLTVHGSFVSGGTGGDINLEIGPTDVGDGGKVNMAAGKTTDPDGNGGAVKLTAGPAAGDGSTSGDGGAVNITAGSSANSTGGSIWIVSGTGETESSGTCLLYTSPSPRDGLLSRMPSSA